ncbi:hypothetical protein DBV15_03781 [Temnothorax longispinosus]|uniref:Uncharacterized protein n=1 Tax=Temnothorax longispinosus TaxID=300112 RepID=A0A4S2JDQ4_9HYME|nr:hypothetical protein DBV15_03781 [Temnothorax longispinosus]
MHELLVRLRIGVINNKIYGTHRGTDVYGGQVYPSGARANQPPAAPPIQDYNLLEECPTQPGIHPRVTWVAALDLTARFSIARSRSQMSPIATLDVGHR